MKNIEYSPAYNKLALCLVPGRSLKRCVSAAELLSVGPQETAGQLPFIWIIWSQMLAQ